MRCPYSDCSKQIELTSTRRFQGCTHCKRPIKLCRRALNGRTCNSFNQPLARFCRTCGTGFSPLLENSLLTPSQDIETTQFSTKSNSGEIEQTAYPFPSAFDVELQTWNPVTCLEDDTLRPNTLENPIEIGHFGGMLLLSLAEGRFNLVEPFKTPSLVHRYHSQGAKNGRHVPRILTNGPWGVLFSPVSVTVLNLLSLNPNSRASLDDPAFFNWECPVGQRVNSTPLLFECPRPSATNSSRNGTTIPGGKPFDAVVVWSTIDDAARPTIWFAHLSHFDKVPPPIRHATLSVSNGFERFTLINFSANRAVSRPLILVMGTQESFFLQIDPWGDNQPTVLSWRPEFRIGIRQVELGGLSGACFLPPLNREGISDNRSGTDPNRRPLGLVATSSHANTERQMILISYFWDKDHIGHSVIPIERGGIPLSVVNNVGGGAKVLAVDGSELVTVDTLQNREPVIQDQDLNSVTRATVSGSLAILSGVSVTGRWHLLVDLQKSRVISHPGGQSPIPPPVRIGSCLFGLEWIPTGMGPDQLHLVRWDLVSGKQTTFDPSYSEES